MTRTWLLKGNLKRETESLLIVTQNNNIRANYIKSKFIIRKKIASVDNMETDIKLFIA